VYLLQAAILYIVALPIIWINIHGQTIGWNVLEISSILWLGGFFLESIADYQLLRFKQNASNRGQLLTTGLWSYVRHPNYLGEIVQWWAIWVISSNRFLVISPLLITILIVKVSGIAPLEAKMKKHVGFANYARNTPSLIPFPLVNGVVYSLAWFLIIEAGAKGLLLSALFTFIVTYVGQVFLFAKLDRKSLFISPLLSIYALGLGLIQETIFIGFDLLQYSNEGVLPPLWILFLYPLFALTLNSSLRFLNRGLILAFLLGGLGALGSYVVGEKMGAVVIVSPLFYPIVFVSWGFYVTILVLLNRQLNHLREKYTEQVSDQPVLTVFFDAQCPICSGEMQKLQKRKQTGKIDYANLHCSEEFQKKSKHISYDAAMKKIHAIDSEGNVFIGTDALSEVYARTDLSFVAILLQAPGFRQLFIVGYAIWAKIRRVL
jgi:predicted DCC family thiol-disulfide oxidoreductase YuxK/protein-S-isoprenylcysteine O-methyltransferase Ste14